MQESQENHIRSLAQNPHRGPQRWFRETPDGIVSPEQAWEPLRRASACARAFQTVTSGLQVWPAADALARRLGAGGRLGGAGRWAARWHSTGWTRVKSGFVFPILPVAANRRFLLAWLTCTIWCRISDEPNMLGSVEWKWRVA